MTVTKPLEKTNGWVSARNGKWHRATHPEPTFTRDETTACGLTFRPLNVTWDCERPPTTTEHICHRPGCTALPSQLQDKFLNGLADAIVDYALAEFGTEEGCARALAAVGITVVDHCGTDVPHAPHLIGDQTSDTACAGTTLDAWAASEPEGCCAGCAPTTLDDSDGDDPAQYDREVHADAAAELAEGEE